MSHIVVDIAGGVGILTIDRPQRFNSLDVETARDLLDLPIEDLASLFDEYGLALSYEG